MSASSNSSEPQSLAGKETATKESVEEYFNKNNISLEAKEKFISLINECEIARYAPSSNKNQKMTNILEEAEKIILNVEANLKWKK